MVKKIFFTSDTHFGSNRTLKLSKRPFQSTEDMDRIISSNWNSVVNKNDIVFHLGDFGIFNINKLHGKKIFLAGNHDSKFMKNISKYSKIIKPNTVVTINSNRFQLIHEPLEIKNATKEKFVLFGHIHKTQMIKRNGLNVGIDCHNFYPIDLETVLFYKNAIEKFYDKNVFNSDIFIQG